MAPATGDPFAGLEEFGAAEELPDADTETAAIVEALEAEADADAAEPNTEDDDKDPEAAAHCFEAEGE